MAVGFSKQLKQQHRATSIYLGVALFFALFLSYIGIMVIFVRNKIMFVVAIFAAL